MPRQKHFCSIENCNQPVWGHGLCNMHYLRWKRYGRIELLKEQPCKGQKPQYPLPNQPRRELIIWAAGFIDGEGCINIQYRKKARTHYIKLTVPQVNAKPLQILQGLFGGSYRLRSEKPKRESHRPIYVWEVTTNQAYQALVLVCPFLAVKRKQADLAIQFQQGIHRALRNAVSDAERERREQIRQAISQLNQGRVSHLLI